MCAKLDRPLAQPCTPGSHVSLPPSDAVSTIIIQARALTESVDGMSAGEINL